MNYLADTSALARLIPDIQDEYGFNQAIDAGLVGVCDITELEFCYSARTAADRSAILTLLAAAYTWVPIPDGIYQRAREVQQLLTNHGEHRGPGTVDLLVAATAELSNLILLHRDADFETIAKHTGQPTKILPGL
ncbi:MULTISPECIES: PIN domain nuclease [Streptomyces]|uniref:Ribonuclease VapC n=1 Tax=Streptomyces chiangmaiensis TaxID=766497 RepID=A0ABU7FVN5_9ACTN|nr:PIN domain nuclease [Streptomyces chiangmaiensis]MED7827858.1 PIN domain nuclease [Streptomyces chiangmaiensis]